MANSRSRKQRVRARMEHTGETYTQALVAMDREREQRVTFTAPPGERVDVTPLK